MERYVTRTTTKRTNQVRDRSSRAGLECRTPQSQKSPMPSVPLLSSQTLFISSRELLLQSPPPFEATLPSCLTPNQPGKLEVMVSSSLYFPIHTGLIICICDSPFFPHKLTRNNLKILEVNHDLTSDCLCVFYLLLSFCICETIKMTDL